MRRLILITPWAMDPLTADMLPEIQIDYPFTAAGELFLDVTSQPTAHIAPNPNAFIIETIRTDITCDLILSNIKYLVLSEEVV